MSESARVIGTTELAAAALDLAARGWRVLPIHSVANGQCSCGDSACKSIGKHPRTKSGLKDGTTDEAILRRWWRDWPGANVGVCTGQGSGIWMLGPDGEQGINDLSDLVQRYGALPRTPSARSGSGGRHYYFRWPADGKEIVNRRNHHGRKIDVRGEGGYFVAAPSVNAIGTYSWEVRPDQCELADAPAWLLAWARQDPRPKAAPAPTRSSGSAIEERAIKYLNKMPAAVSGQGGHPRTMEAARVVVWGFDLGVEMGYSLLASHYNPRCEPPWTERELRHKCEEADRVPYGKPRGWLIQDRSSPRPSRASGPRTGTTGTPPAASPKATTAPAYRPFPTHCLPEPVRSYIELGAKSLKVDPAYVALPALAVLAGSIGNSRVIRLKAGWIEPCVLWTALVADSGTLKTPAWWLAVGHCYAKQRLYVEAWKAKLARHKDELDAWRAAKRAAAASSPPGTPPPGPPPEPTMERAVCDDVTWERLAEILQESPRGVLVAKDELEDWFNSFTRYSKGGQSADRPRWLKAHRAGPILVERKGGDNPLKRTTFVPRGAVSLCGSIPPKTYKKAMTQDHTDAGLSGRLLVAAPEDLGDDEWTEEFVPTDVENRWKDLLDQLSALPMKLDALGGNPEPQILNLSPDGKKAWINFYRVWRKRLAAAQGDMRASLSKLEGTAARFAMIHHLVTRIAGGGFDLDPVEEESVAAGTELARWFADEADRLSRDLGQPEESRDLRKLILYIQRHEGKVTVRELQRSNGYRYPDADAALAALTQLAEAGHGSLSYSSPRTGGPTTTTFTLYDPLPTGDDCGQTGFSARIFDRPSEEAKTSVGDFTGGLTEGEIPTGAQPSPTDGEDSPHETPSVNNRRLSEEGEEDREPGEEG